MKENGVAANERSGDISKWLWLNSGNNRLAREKLCQKRIMQL
jgi:hypothetical protein